MGKARKKPGQAGGTAPLAAPMPLPRKWDCSGGTDFDSRGLERQLGEAIIGMLRLLKGCPSDWKLKTPSWPEGYLRGTRGTPNHRFGCRIAYYIWAMMQGTGGQPAAWQNDASDLVADFFETQEREGHMLGEMNTPSHHPIWDYEVAAVRAVALHFNDQRIIELSGRWYRHNAYILDLTAVDGVPTGPGARPNPGAKDHPEYAAQSPYRTAMYALYRGVASPPLPKGYGNPNVPGNAFWSNPANVAAWVVRELIRDGDDLGGVTRGEREEPVLRDKMMVDRRGDDFVAEISEFTKSGPGVLPWVARINGEWSTSKEYRKGQQRNWKSPERAPDLGAGATLTIVRGANCRPYDMDSDEDGDEGEVA